MNFKFCGPSPASFPGVAVSVSVSVSVPSQGGAVPFFPEPRDLVFLNWPGWLAEEECGSGAFGRGVEGCTPA